MCQMDILMLHEYVAEELMGSLMPINTARNYALLAVRGTARAGGPAWDRPTRCTRHASVHQALPQALPAGGSGGLVHAAP